MKPENESAPTGIEALPTRHVGETQEHSNPTAQNRASIDSTIRTLQHSLAIPASLAAKGRLE